MGNPMCGHLLNSNYELYIYNRSKDKAQNLLKLGAHWCSNPKEVALKSDLIITIVGFPEDVINVYFEQEGIFEGIKPNSILVDMTTSKPQIAIDVYEKAGKIAREEHIPIIIHVTDLMQPIGHSSSGSHERYKSKERLEYEKSIDCNSKMREWILNYKIEDEEGNIFRFVDDESELKSIEKEAEKEARQAKRNAWNTFREPIKKDSDELLVILNLIR